MAPKYREVVDAELMTFWGWSYEGFVRKFLESTQIQKRDLVLDIATGTGEIPFHIRDNLNGNGPIQIHGLDITLPMLQQAQNRMNNGREITGISWTCASAMDMPYSNGYFTLAMCCLATHHMDVPRLLQEMGRVLVGGGRIAIADAGGVPLWRVPGVKWAIRFAAFLYFLAKENWSRAWAEAEAVSHVFSTDQWEHALLEANFEEITIVRMKSKHFWVPSPLVLTAIKVRQ